MGQPTLSNLFGTNASYNNSTGILTLNLNDLETDTGITPSTAEPAEIFGAIIYYASNWLLANTDETVNITVSRSVFAPITRNNQEKTQYSINYQLYGSYTEPVFDADDLV